MWRTEDGVTWTPVEIDVPFGSLHNTRFTADSVYVVGTAPGIAADRPNPLLLGVSHDDGETWDQIELPVDTNAGHDLPFITEVGASAVVYPIEDGAVVWLYTGPNSTTTQRSGAVRRRAVAGLRCGCASGRCVCPRRPNLPAE